MQPNEVLLECYMRRIVDLEQTNATLVQQRSAAEGRAASLNEQLVQQREEAAASKAAAEAARAQLARSEEQQRAASAELAKLRQEKELLLENMHRLIAINKSLQDAVTAERAKQQAKPRPRGEAAAAEQAEPRTTTPPQHQQQQHDTRDQPSSASRKRGPKAAAAGAGRARKRAKKPAAAAAAAAAGQEQAARAAEAAAAAAARARDYLQQQQQKQQAEQQQRAAEADAASRQRASEAARQREAEAQREQQEAERQRQAAAAAAQGGRPPAMGYGAPQPDLDSLPISGLKDFLKQAGVDGGELRGLLEKGELLQCARAHMQLWECRRLCVCDELGRHSPALRLFAAACVFRIPLLPPGLNLAASVRAAKEGLKRTRARLALLVHPDKAVGGLGRYKAVFDEAFRVLEDAHATLTAAADEAPQQQQQQWAAQGFSCAIPPGWAFPPGFVPGFTAFNQGGARKG